VTALFREEYALYAPAAPTASPGTTAGGSGGGGGQSGGFVPGGRPSTTSVDRRARLAARMAAAWAPGAAAVGPSGGTDEVLAYCLAPVADAALVDEALLAWWSAQAGQYPTLARMARDFLAMQASSAACERQFSGARWVVRATRSRLRGPAIRALMCLDDWLPRAEVRPLELAHHRSVAGARGAADASGAPRGDGGERWDDLFAEEAGSGEGVAGGVAECG
jgi:hypothetical protein